MKIKKLAVVLAAALSLGSLTVPAAADTIVVDGEMDESTGLVYKVEGDGWSVSCLPTNSNNPLIGDITVPETWTNAEGTEKTVLKIKSELFSFPDKITSISIPKTVTTIDTGYGYHGTSLQAITVAADNKNFTSENGVLYNKDKTTLLRYPAQKGDKTFTIPNTVIAVENNAFSGVQNLTSITIPEGVTTINSFTFSFCYKLTELTIPSTVTNFQYGYVNFFTAYTVAEANENYSAVDGILFNKDKTELIGYPRGKTEASSYTVPDTVTKLGNWALYNEAITEVTIPISVTEIGTNVFGEWKPVKINYEGTKEQWNAITKSESNTAITRYGVTCSDGVIEGTDDPDDTTVQSPSKSENEDGTLDYVPEVKKANFSDSVMEDVKAVKVNAPTDSFADEVNLQVAPKSAASSQFSVDIKFVKASDGTKVQPAKPVTVKIPVPENMKNADPIYVYHTDDNGRISKVAAATETIAGKKYVVFTADRFSVYTLSAEVLDDSFDPILGGTVPNITPVAPTTDTTAATENTSTTEAAETTVAQSSENENNEKDKNQATGVMIAVIPAMLAAAGVAIFKKRK